MLLPAFLIAVPHSLQVCVYVCTVCVRFILSPIEMERLQRMVNIKVGINRSNSHSIEPTAQFMVLFLKSANLGIWKCAHTFCFLILFPHWFQFGWVWLCIARCSLPIWISSDSFSSLFIRIFNTFSGQFFQRSQNLVISLRWYAGVDVQCVFGVKMAFNSLSICFRSFFFRWIVCAYLSVMFVKVFSLSDNLIKTIFPSAQCPSFYVSAAWICVYV